MQNAQSIKPGSRLSTRQKLRNIARNLRVMIRGGRFEWNIDLQSARRPVLLIHGFAMPRRCMAILQNRLAADGFDVFAFRLGPANFRGVEKAAHLISEKLRSASGRYGAQRIAIVGHSLGGIIGRALIVQGDGDRLFHTLITLGSPHQGHPSWKWIKFTPVTWFTHVPRELAPESNIMTRLRNSPLPRSVYAVSLFSEADRICPAAICPLDVPPGADNIVNIPLQDVNHIDLMVDERVHHIVRDHLEIGFRRAALE